MVNKLVYGEDLVKYGQKVVNKLREEVVDNLNSSDVNKPLSSNQGRILNESKLDKTAKAETAKLSDESVRLKDSRNIIITGDLNGATSFDGTDDATLNVTLSGIDASKITSGIIDIDRLPKTALSDFVPVANQEERFQLTTLQVQKGDTVKEVDTGRLYLVVDETKLNMEEGYQEYTTTVEWATIKDKPNNFPPERHTQGSDTITSLTNYEKLSSSAITPSDSLNVALGKLEGQIGGKENAINKQSGFNLPKSDAVNVASSEQLATSLAVKTAYDKGAEALTKANEVDDKVSKSGDTMTGKLIANGGIETSSIIARREEYPEFYLETTVDTNVGAFGYNANSGAKYIYIRGKSKEQGKALKLYDNGNSFYPANNLVTTSKEVVGAINEIVLDRWRTIYKSLSDGSNSTPINLNNIQLPGYYKSADAVLEVINKPEEVTGAFELTVTGISYDNLYTTQLIKDYRNNDYWVRTNNSYDQDNPNWSNWERLNDTPSVTKGDGYTCIKYKDGRMILTVTVQETETPSNTIINFPVGFSAPPTVTFTVDYFSGEEQPTIANVWSVGTNSFKTFLSRTIFYYHYVAYGYWK